MDEQASQFAGHRVPMFVPFLLLFGTAQDPLNTLSLFLDLLAAAIEIAAGALSELYIGRVSMAGIVVVVVEHFLFGALERPEMRDSTFDLSPRDGLVYNLVLDLLELKHRSILQLIDLDAAVLDSPQLEQSILDHIAVDPREVKCFHLLRHFLHVFKFLQLPQSDGLAVFRQHVENSLDVIFGYLDAVAEITYNL